MEAKVTSSRAEYVSFDIFRVLKSDFYGSFVGSISYVLKYLLTFPTTTTPRYTVGYLRDQNDCDVFKNAVKRVTQDKV
jgi:hypothetical protein